MTKITLDPSNLSDRERADIRQSVEGVIASGVLGSSTRRASLLHYIVAKELDSRGDEIKAYSIALDVMGRGESFDPNTDSIVRSEIGRLRDALRLYSAEQAVPGQIVLEIPKGTYRPSFYRLHKEKHPAPPMGFVTRRVSAFILTFAVLSMVWFFSSQPLVEGSTDQTNFSSTFPFDVIRVAVAQPTVSGIDRYSERLSQGMRAELMIDLSAYTWLSVVAPINGLDSLKGDDIDYALNVDVVVEDAKFQIHTTLTAFPSEKLVWSNIRVVDAEPRAVRGAIAEFGSEVASEIGSVRGLAPALTRKKNAYASDESLEAFLCFLGFHRYIGRPTDETHLDLRQCLLKAVSEFPEYGDGWAALGLLYIDEARFARNPRPGAEPWKDASFAVSQARRFAPLRMPTLNVALILEIEGPQRDLEEFNRVSDLLLELYPRHPPTLNNVGSRKAEFTGSWDAGLAFVGQAIALHPEPPSAYFVTHAYYAALGSDDDAAYAAVQPLDGKTSESQLILRYAAASRKSLINEMASSRELLSLQGLVTDEDIINHVLARRYTTELEDALVEQLKRAMVLEASQ